MISKFILKRAAIFTLFFFVGLCLSSSLAVANENTPAPANEKSQSESTGIEKSETGPGVTEVESPDSAKTVLKAKKKFPWLLVGAGVVVVGVLVYLLLGKKKEQTLTVNLGAGATGTPAVTAKYKKDAAVSYNYTPQAGYSGLQVKLDGVAVAASGSVNMDKDHTLDVSASQQYTLTVSIGAGTTGTPAATASYNKDQIVNYSYTVLTGYSSLQVKLDGIAVASSGAVTMSANHTLDVSSTQQYTLTVNLGTGTTGTPAATASYNKDQVVNYSYTVLGGYSTLQVKLDGVAVVASGTVTMSANHSLIASATKIYSNGVLTVNGVRYVMASIPAGTFKMGSNSTDASSDEQPVHTVQISKRFWMGKTEVTQGLWRAVMGSNPPNFNGDNYPVEWVSYDDCEDFIKKLNRLVTGGVRFDIPFRLPTEAEWEYACRAGTTGERYGNLDAIAWYDGPWDGSTHPVGLKQPNSWGLYDMLGNVWEWCHDYYEESYYSHSPQNDPQGPSYTPFNLYRGGGWKDHAKEVRSANRQRFTPNNTDNDLGFRLASE